MDLVEIVNLREWDDEGVWIAEVVPSMTTRVVNPADYVALLNWTYDGHQLYVRCEYGK